MAPEGRVVGAVLLALSTALLSVACDTGDTEAQRTQAYMDSLAVYLGELRVMDHELDQIVSVDTLSAEYIVPLISERFQPTVADLRQRAAAMPTTAAVDTAQTLLLHYLDVRLEAYDAAIRGRNEDRPELYDEFARKQIEAQTLGDELEAMIQTVRGHLPLD